MGEDGGCCGEDGGCGVGDCGSEDCGDVGSGIGDCGEGNDCCKKQSTSALTEVARGTDGSATEEEKPKEVGKVLFSDKGRTSDLPIWFKMGFIALLLAILFRLTEVVI